MTGRKTAFALLMLSALSTSTVAHEVKLVPLDEMLLPITVADQHVLVSPTAIDFGEAAVGASVVRTFQIENASTQSQSVTVGFDSPVPGLTLSAGDEAFELTPGSAPRQLTVTYAPTTTNPGFSVSMTVVATDPLGNAQPSALALSGSAIGSFVAASPSSFDFGEVLLSTSATRSLTVTNESSTSQTITLRHASSSGLEPPLSFPSAPLELAAGATTSLDIVYTPTSATDHLDAHLELSSVGPNGAEQIVPIPAVGVVIENYATVAPLALDFGPVVIGDSARDSFWVTNLSRAPVSVRALLPSGQPLILDAGDDDFQLTVGGNREANITFAPLTVDSPPLTRITVLVTNEDGYIQRFFVDLAGQGVAPSLAIVDPVTGAPIQALSFSSSVGSSASRTIRLLNDGQAPVSGRIDGLGPIGGLACWWDVCFWRAGTSIPASPYSLPLPGDFLDVEVRFEPVRPWGPTPKVLEFLGGLVPQPLSVTVQADDPVEIENVVVDAHLILDAVEHDFGVVAAGQSAETTVRLTNAGTAAAAVKLLGVGAGGCSLDVCFSALTPGIDLQGFTLAAGASVDVRAVFAPQAEGLPFALTAHFVGGAEPALLTVLGTAVDSSGTKATGSSLTPVPLDIQGFRGMVNDNTFLSSTEIDHISLMTRNLVVTLPLGQQVRIGPQLSHGLTLVYNGTAWDATTTDDGLPWGNYFANPLSAPAWGTNAGLGWRLSLGELYERNTRGSVFADLNQAPHWPNRTLSLDWLYVAPDGSKIYFEGTGTAGVYRSRDGSFLQLQEGPGAMPDPVTLEFPDGSQHEFERSSTLCDRGDRCWRLKRIRDAFGNQATLEYLGFATDTPRIEIRYPFGRTSTLELSKSRAAGAGQADLGDLRLLVTGVQVPKFGGGTATYGFLYAGDAAAQPSGVGEPDYTQRIVRGCPANVQAGNQQRMSVPILRQLVLPTGDDYVFSYDVDTDPLGDRCHLASGTLTQIVLPTEAEIRYRWGATRLPSLCTEFGDNPPVGELKLVAPFSLTPAVAERQLIRADGTPGAWTQYIARPEELLDHYQVVNKQCFRDNLMVTDVIHGPNVGSDLAPEYKVERFYHTTTRPSDVGVWKRAAYGLPIHLGVTGSTHFGTGDVWLSSETATCPDADFDHPGCVVERRNYKHFRWLGGGGCNLEEDSPECHRSLDALDLQRRTFGGGSHWIDERHTDYDGRGHYRQTETRSNFHWQAGTVTTTSERTEYLGPVSFPTGSQIYVSTPGPGAPWLLNLFTEKRSNPDGRDRVEEFDFDPATGFLRCQRTLEILVTPGAPAVRSTDDIARRFDRAQANGYVVWEEVAGGDGGGLDTTAGAAAMCPDAASAMVYRTFHTYTDGERATSQPKTVSGADLGPPTLYREIDVTTGLASAACDFASNPPTCEKHTYDSVGRLTTVDRGWELVAGSLREKANAAEHLADTTYTYTAAAGGSVHAQVKKSGGTAIRQEAKIFFDGLGVETDTWVKSLADGASRWVKQPVFHHPRGFKTQVVTPQLDNRAECQGTTLCRQTFHHDIYGRVTNIKSPALNRSAGTTPSLPSWIVPEVREETRISRGAGLIHEETTRQFFCDGETVRRVTSDHLGRPLRVREETQGMALPECPPNGVQRTTFTGYSAGVVTTSRDPGAVGGPTQSRVEKRDGRGFLIEEIQPEWQDGAAPQEKATYQYDALGNLTYEKRPDGTELTYQRDGRGRLLTVTAGSGAKSKVVKSYTYEPATAQPATATRIQHLDSANTFGFFPAATATLTETFGYDSNGLLETRNTRLIFDDPPAYDNATLYDVDQGWAYNDLGQVSRIDYPNCLPTGQKCGLDNSGAPSRNVTHSFINGALRNLNRDGSLVARHDYHPNGVSKRIDFYRGGVFQWHDDTTTGPFGAATVTRIESFDAAGLLRWETGEYLFNGRGVLRALFPASQPIPTTSFGHDLFDRQVGYNLFGMTQEYLYDDYDNLLELDFFDGAQNPTFRNVFGTDPASNRLVRLTRYQVLAGGGESVVLDFNNFAYDGRGQLAHFDRSYFAYGPFGEPTAYLRETFGAPIPDPADGYEYQAIHLYNASDERVVTVDRKLGAQGDENLILYFGKDLDGNVLREMRWTFAGGDQRSYKDYYWSNGRLLGIEEEVGGVAKLRHAHLDHLGSLRLLTDGQAVTGSQEFEPWGTRVPGTGTIPERIAFTGQEADRNDLVAPASDGLGLTYDFGPRAYAPIAGRFFAPDPARDASTWSLYGYAGNNPIMNNDPTGLACNEAFGPTGGCDPKPSDEESPTDDDDQGKNAEAHDDHEEAEGVTLEALQEKVGGLALPVCTISCTDSPLVRLKDLGIAGFITPFALVGGVIGDVFALPARLSSSFNEKLQDKARRRLALREGEPVPAPILSMALSLPIELASHALGFEYHEGIQPRPEPRPRPEPFVPRPQPRRRPPFGQ